MLHRARAVCIYDVHLLIAYSSKRHTNTPLSQHICPLICQGRVVQAKPAIRRPVRTTSAMDIGEHSFGLPGFKPVLKSASTLRIRPVPPRSCQ